MSRVGAWIGLALLLFAGRAWAQDVRPGDERLELPGFETPEEARRAREPRLDPLPRVPDFVPDAEEPGRVLPAVPPEAPDERRAPVVRSVHVEGNTVLPEARLDEIAKRYVGRPITQAGLVELRDRITMAYVEAGYVTSGAVLSDEPIVNGEVVIRVIEGRLAAIEIESAGRLRERYLRSRLRLDIDGPLDLRTLERNLSRLQRSEQILSIQGRLEPGDALGESVLRVVVVEASAWRLGVGVNNGNSPTIGEWRAGLHGGHVNVSGFADSLDAGFRASSGMYDVRADYRLPITARDTALTAHYRQTWTEVVEDPIARFDISSRIASFGAGLEQPLLRTDASRVAVFALFEWRRSRSFLAGEPFSFLPGPQDGVATVAPIRIGVDWTWRTGRQALAARTQLSFGLPVMHATQNPGDIPDGRFVSWLAQLQYARRLGEAGPELLLRAETQIATDPLLSMEQFAVGGFRTVRGYRENFVVRDNGAVGSAELRIPVPIPRFGDWRPGVSVVPFLDAGYGWSAVESELPAATLLSVGVGTRMSLFDGVLFELFWGMPLLAKPGFSADTLQDHGVQVGLSWEY